MVQKMYLNIHRSDQNLVNYALLDSTLSAIHGFGVIRIILSMIHMKTS